MSSNYVTNKITQGYITMTQWYNIVSRVQITQGYITMTQWYNVVSRVQICPMLYSNQIVFQFMSCDELDITFKVAKPNKSAYCYISCLYSYIAQGASHIHVYSVVTRWKYINSNKHEKKILNLYWNIQPFQREDSLYMSDGLDIS